MKIALLKASTIRHINRGALLVRKFSPEILTGVGIVSVVAGAVMASKATLKLEEIVNEHEVALSEGDFEEDNAGRSRVFIETGTKIAKLYSPSVAVGVAGIGCIVGGHTILSRRNAAITAAYSSLAATLSTAKVAEKVQQVGEDGEIVETTEEDLSWGPKSPFVAYFDRDSLNFQPREDYNLMFLRTVQQHANDRLLSRGHIFLNEVLDDLGIERTQAGSVLGWVRNDDRGDNYVDFGLESDQLFVYTEEDRENEIQAGTRPFLLEFNVDGVIWDKI